MSKLFICFNNLILRQLVQSTKRYKRNALYNTDIEHLWKDYPDGENFTLYYRINETYGMYFYNKIKKTFLIFYHFLIILLFI